ncbi:Uncharacterized protein dnm_009530 [Desulfonema magnum]|uniref:Uncharacterized protein n=1 Tax=Desulfonema magnum TaxID=45655 RepID=A0A975BFT4_9BACT|nr:Uncharacterized protein dnm_009530 [Desulfonema magnum]
MGCIADYVLYPIRSISVNVSFYHKKNLTSEMLFVKPNTKKQSVLLKICM